MADDPKPVQDTLTPEQKTWLDTELKRVETETVTKTKTQLEDERKKSVPDKYEFQFADGSPLDPKVDAEKIALYAKAQGFSKEQAAAHLKHLDEMASQLTARQQALLAETANKWADDVKADKELGGPNFETTAKHIHRAIDRFGTEDFKKLLNESGYGNHPEFVRFVVKVGKAMAEDKPLSFWATDGQTKPRKSDAEVFYPKTSNM